MNKDLKQLSNEEFYDLLCKVYSISLTEQDYLKIISKRNSKKYNRFTEINTFMTFNDTATEGRGKGFSWWQQLYQVSYIVAVSHATEIKYNSILRKDDIKRMVEDKSIVIVKLTSKPIDQKLSINEEFESIPTMELNCSYSYGNIYGSICKDENFPIVVSMLRKKFTKNKILKDMKEYVENLQEEMEIVLSDAQPDYAYNEISKLCNEWYNKSEEKEIIKSLQKNLMMHKCK